VKLSPVLLPASVEFAPTFHAPGFFSVACVVLVLPICSRLPDTPLTLKLVNSLVVPPVNWMRPMALLVSPANLLEPVTVMVPAPPQLSPDGMVKVIYVQGPEGILLELVQELKMKN
jgi:hypothetical protein